MTIFHEIFKTHTVWHDAAWAIPMFLCGALYGWIKRRFIFPRNVYPFYDYARFGFTVFSTLTIFLVVRAFASDGRVDWYVDVVIYYWVTFFSLGSIAGYWSVSKDHKPRPIHAGIEHTEDGILLVDPDATTAIHDQQQHDHPSTVVVIEDNLNEKDKPQ